MLAGVLATQVASRADEPGLPPPQGAFPQYAGAETTSLNEAAASRQFFRLPKVIIVADTDFKAAPSPGVQVLFKANNFVRSPKSARAPFGYFPTFKVNNLAFGVVPSVATIQLEQLRDQNDLPVPWVITQKLFTDGTYDNAILTGEAKLSVVGLSIDGVEVDLGPGGCTPRANVTLRLESKGVYNVNQGGFLLGTADVPAFKKCGVGGEDLSPLLTSMIAGRGNPAAAFQALQSSACLPPNFSDYQEGPCTEAPPLKYPTRDDPMPQPPRGN